MLVTYSPRMPSLLSHCRFVVAALSLLGVTLSSSVARAEEEEAELPNPGDALSYESDDGRFGIEPLAQLQTLLRIEQDLGAEGAGSAGFMVRRARIGLDGHLFSKDLRFQIEGNWDRGQPALQDAFLAYAIAPLVVVQAGQYKRPFSRDFITSSSKSLTFERVSPQGAFFIGRDVGVMLHNNFTKSPGLEYAVGVFNGTGDDVRLTSELPDFSLSHVPELFHPAFVGRLGVNLGGIRGYEEGDLEGGPLRLAVASSVALDAPTQTNAGLASAEVDFALKAYGAWATGAVFLESGPLDGLAGEGAVGLHLEGSYTLADSLLPVVAYGLVAPLGGNTARHELTGGAAVLLFGYNFRLLTDAVLGIDQAPGVISSDVAVRFGAAMNL